MNINGIQAQFVRKMQWKAKTSKRIKQSICTYPDMVQRQFNSVKERFKVLYTDVTYHIWNGKKFYQSTIIDGYTKEIIDFKLSYFNDLKLVMDNLNDALVEINKKWSKRINYPLRSWNPIYI